MITNIVAYTDKFDSAYESMKDKILNSKDYRELTPDNTLGDLFSVMIEGLLREISGDYWNATLGELSKLSKEDRHKIVESIFGDGEWSQEFVPKK